MNMTAIKTDSIEKTFLQMVEHGVLTPQRAFDCFYGFIFSMVDNDEITVDVGNDLVAQFRYKAALLINPDLLNRDNIIEEYCKLDFNKLLQTKNNLTASSDKTSQHKKAVGIIEQFLNEQMVELGGGESPIAALASVRGFLRALLYIEQISKVEYIEFLLDFTDKMIDAIYSCGGDKNVLFTLRSTQNQYKDIFSKINNRMEKGGHTSCQ